MMIIDAVVRYSESHVQSKFPELSLQNKRIAFIAGTIFCAMVFLIASSLFWLFRKVKKHDDDSNVEPTSLSSPSSGEVKKKALELETIFRSLELSKEQRVKALNDLVDWYLIWSIVLADHLIRWKASKEEALTKQLLDAIHHKVRISNYGVQQSFENSTKGNAIPNKTVSSTLAVVPLSEDEWLKKLVAIVRGDNLEEAKVAMEDLDRFKYKNPTRSIPEFEDARFIYFMNCEKKPKQD